MSRATPHCHDCLWYKHVTHSTYVAMRHPPKAFRKRKRATFWATGTLCAHQRKEDFPLKLAEMSNWDPDLLPQYCNRFKRRPLFYIFGSNNPHNRYDLHFVGAYSTVEMARKAEMSMINIVVCEGFSDFNHYFRIRKMLLNLASSLPVKLPLDDDEITPELVWGMIQTTAADNDSFGTLNLHHWVRSWFPGIKAEATYAQLSRWGMYPRISVMSILRDLRNPKYARGPAMRIVKCPEYRIRRSEGPMQNVPRLCDMTEEQQYESCKKERYRRVK